LRILTYFLLGLGGLIAIAALSIVFLDDSEPETVAPQAEAEQSVTRADPAGNGAGSSSAESASADATAKTQDAGTASDSATGLVIDLAQVRPDGQAVFAGQGAPGARITVFEGDILLGETIADANGEWVVILEKMLAPGQHLVSVGMETDDGKTQIADAMLAIEITENRDEQPLVAVLPQADTEVPKLLQSPDDTAAALPAEEEGQDTEPKTESGGALVATSETEAAQKSVASKPSAPEASTQDLSEPVETADATPTVPALAPRAIVWRSKDEIAISGVSRGGVRVAAALDGDAFGEALVLSDGEWTIGGRIDRAAERVVLTFGLYDSSGARVTTYVLPTSIRDLDVGLDGSQMVVINRGDALWRIAYRSFGEGVRYVDIVRRNTGRIDDPDLIYPNQIFALPKP